MLLNRYRWVVLGLAGVLSSLGAPPFYIFPAPIFAFAILGVWFQLSKGKHMLVGVGVFIFARLLAGHYWMALAPSVLVGPIGYLAGVVFILLGCSLYTLQYMLLMSPIGLLQSPRARFILFVTLMSLANLASELIFLPTLPWQMPALEWSVIPWLANSVAIFGSQGLSMFVLIVTGLLAMTLVHLKPLRALAAAAMILVFLLILGGVNIYTNEKDPDSYLNVRIVQPNTSIGQFQDRSESRKIVERLLHISTRDKRSSPDLIVWPETALPYAYLNDDLNKYIRARIGPQSVVVWGQAEIVETVKSTKVEDQGSSQTTNKIYNSMVLLDLKGTAESIYRKQHLVPFGEYLPLADWLSGLEEAAPVLKSLIRLFPRYTAGEESPIVNHPSLPAFLAVICYEVIFSTEMIAWHAENDKRPQMIINITEDGWFGKHTGPFQHAAHARLRAIEQGVPLIRSANTGISIAYDAFGRNLGELPLSSAGYIDVVVPINQTNDEPLFFTWNYSAIWLLLVVMMMYAAGVDYNERQNARSFSKPTVKKSLKKINKAKARKL